MLCATVLIWANNRVSFDQTGMVTLPMILFNRAHDLSFYPHHYDVDIERKHITYKTSSAWTPSSASASNNLAICKIWGTTAHFNLPLHLSLC